MNIKWIEITGLRGFFETTRIDLALPNGNSSSGMTVLIGPNNSGKTTIIEALNALSKNKISISEDKRNNKAKDKVKILFRNTDDNDYGIQTIEQGSSEIKWINTESKPAQLKIFVLRSRRVFNPSFQKNCLDRDPYMEQYGYTAQRPREINEFAGRLFNAFKDEKTKRAFNDDLAKILDNIPNWTIDQSVRGDYFLKINYDKFNHSSDGLGEGIISLFFIVDAFYDLKENQIIVIDEPELSLHPYLQNKLDLYLSEYAKKHQIIIATHSPNFISWETINNGKIIRTKYDEEKGISIFSLSKDVIDKLKRIRKDVDNPHILGQDAKETLFLEDKIVLLEGQDDSYCYKNEILKQLNVRIKGEFFGWGAGGAEKMIIICDMLNDLGFKRVGGILDKGKEGLCGKLKEKYKNYEFIVSPASDVRTKNGNKGLLDERKNIRIEFKEETKKIIDKLNEYFCRR